MAVSRHSATGTHLTGHPIDYTLGCSVVFSGSVDPMALFRLDQVPDGGWPPSSKMSTGHVSLIRSASYLVLGYGFHGLVEETVKMVKRKQFVWSN